MSRSGLPILQVLFLKAQGELSSMFQVFLPTWHQIPRNITGYPRFQYESRRFKLQKFNSRVSSVWLAWFWALLRKWGEVVQADIYDMNFRLGQSLSFIWFIIAAFGQSPSRLRLYFLDPTAVCPFRFRQSNKNGHGYGDINFDDLFNNHEYEDGCNPNERSRRKCSNDGYVDGRFWQLQAFCTDPLLWPFSSFGLTIALDAPELEYNRQLLSFIQHPCPVVLRLFPHLSRLFPPRHFPRVPPQTTAEIRWISSSEAIFPERKRIRPAGRDGRETSRQGSWRKWGNGETKRGNRSHSIGADIERLDSCGAILGQLLYYAFVHV